MVGAIFFFLFMFTHKKCEQVKKHFKVGIICPEIRWLNDLIVAMVFHTVADFVRTICFEAWSFPQVRQLRVMDR